MTEHWKRLLASVLASGLLLPMGTGQAADIKERTLRLAFVNPIEHPWGVGAQKFVSLVDERSGGKMKIRLYPGGTLGGDLQLISSVQGGTLDMSMTATGVFAGTVKESIVFDLPFLFNDPEEADAVIDGPVGKKLMEKFREKGLMGIAYWEHGFRNLTTSKRPVAKWEDIQGLKLRVLQVPMYIDLFNSLGANATPLPLPELYTALETGTVDGQENPFVTIETFKFNEVQKHASITRHVYNPLMVYVGKKTWDRLSEDERKILVDAANEVRPFQRQVSRDMEAKAIESVRSKGMTVVEVTPEERERMREKLKPVTEKYQKEAGEELVREMFAEIEKIRGRK
jgi:tripartite ATP-independent transporter DctP family solute receptor